MAEGYQTGGLSVLRCDRPTSSQPFSTVGKSGYIMPDTEKIENLIVGDGEPGKYMARDLARQGRRTVVVERARLPRRRQEPQRQRPQLRKASSCATSMTAWAVSYAISDKDL
jgi:hypothetical protein